MKTKTKVFSDVIRKYEQTVVELEANITDLKREVSQTAEQMIAKIRENERQIITALEKTCASRENRLNSAKAQVQSLLKQIHQAIEFAENLIQRSSSSDIMQTKNYLEQRFNHLENTLIPEVPVNSFPKFYPTNEVKNLTLGYIVASKPVVGLTKDFQAGVESEFEVYPRILGEQVFEVKVLVEPADKIGSLTTCEKQDGDYTVKFTPEVPGTFNIIIKVNGKEFAGSPYTVQVKQQLIQVVGEVEIKGKPLVKPSGIAVNSKGQIAVSDHGSHCIRITDKEGNCVRKVGCYGNNVGQLKFIVSEWGNNCLKVFDSTGKFLYKIEEPGKGDGQLKLPYGLCLQKCGNHHNLLVCNRVNGRVDQITVEGCFTGKTVVKLQAPIIITTTPDGLILVTDYKAKKIHILK